MNPYRKLLVSAVNALLDRGEISLDSDDVCSCVDFDRMCCIGHSIKCEIFGCESVINYTHISFGEVRINIWWDFQGEEYNETLKTDTPVVRRSELKNHVAVCVGGWLERKTGKYLQGRKTEAVLMRYRRKGELSKLNQLKAPKCHGFAPEGQFFA